MNNRSQLDIQSLPLLHQGKVRDIYDINQDKMLIVTTDRISAFDVIMNETIPHKGQVLNQMASFWFKKIEGIVPNHLTYEKVSQFVTEDEALRVKNRAVDGRSTKKINQYARLISRLDLNLPANFQKPFLPHQIKLRWVIMMRIFQWQAVLN